MGLKEEMLVVNAAMAAAHSGERMSETDRHTLDCARRDHRGWQEGRTSMLFGGATALISGLGFMAYGNPYGAVLAVAGAGGIAASLKMQRRAEQVEKALVAKRAGTKMRLRAFREARA